MPVITKVDTSKLKKRLAEMQKNVHRTAPEVLESEGRVVALSLARSTQPFGTGSEAKEMGERAVIRDIAKVYATVASIYPKLPDNVAPEYWKLIRLGKYDAARDLLSKTKFSDVRFGKFDGGDLHRRARSSSSGRVGAHSMPDLIVEDSDSLEEYVDKKREMVGFAKSAWAAIARSLGGTRGLRAPKLPSGERDITSVWITHKKAPFFIGRRDWGGSRPVITLQSDVKYAGHVLSESQMQNAIRIARQRIMKQIEIAARYEMRQARAA